MAYATITFATGASLEGRALARTADVTLQGNTVNRPAMVTAVENGLGLAPQGFALFQNYPNPFNPTTNIQFTVPVTGKATLKIFNIFGQEVATLFNGEEEAGKHNQVQLLASSRDGYLSVPFYCSIPQKKFLIFITMNCERNAICQPKQC